MRRAAGIIVATIGLALLMASASAFEARSPAPVRLDPKPAAAAPFTPWRAATAFLPGPGDIGRGQECPGGSGSFCTDRFPVCCSAGGRFSCQASPADCR